MSCELSQLAPEPGRFPNLLAISGMPADGLPGASFLRADCNADGQVDISDAIAALGFLFLGQGGIPLPGASVCGADPTVDPAGCGAYEGCP